MLRGCNMVPVQFFVVQDHTDYHSPPASLSSSTDFLHLGFGLLCPFGYPNPTQVPKLGLKMSQHWTYIWLKQALGFPCSVCKDLSSDRALLRLFSPAARSQNLSSHEKLRSGGQGGILTFSLLFWESSTGIAQPTALLLHPRLYRWLVWRREIVTLEEMNGIYQVLYPGYSIDLYLLHKGEKTWIAVWVEREHLPAASWQTAWGLQHED